MQQRRALRPALARISLLARVGTVLAAFLWVPVPGAVAAQDGAEFSEANRLLFFTDHLEGVGPRSVLRYDFLKLLPLAESFEDTVELRVARPAKEDGATVQVRYLSGPRERKVPPIENATGNPILLLFLQREASEMAERSGGSARHFQNRIKAALEDNAELTPVSIELDGRQLEGTRIRIAPYLDDPYRARFADEAGKVYDFTLSDDIPGTIYELRSAVPSEDPGGTAEARESWDVIRYRGE